MRTISCLVVTSALTFCAGAANAELIDFEDLDASTGIWIPQGYHGFSWLGGGYNDGLTSWVNSANIPLCFNNPLCSQWPAYSGVNYAWSDGGVYLELSDGLFNIESLMISAFSTTVTFEGLLNGATVFTKSIDVNESSYKQAVLNFNGIDTLRFDSDVNYNLVIDDISFSRASVSTPGTLFLFGLSVAILGCSRLKSV